MFTFFLFLFLSLAVVVGYNHLFRVKWYRPILKGYHSVDKSDRMATWIITSIVVYAGLVVFWVFYSNMTYHWHDMHEPICVKHIGTYPVTNHWSSPNKKFVNIPDDVSRFDVYRNDGRVRRRVTPGERLYLNADYITGYDSRMSDSLKTHLNVYMFEYKSWGPFSVPYFFKKGFISYDEAEIYKRGNCKTHADLKE